MTRNRRRIKPDDLVDFTPWTVNEDIFGYLKEYAARSLPQDRYVILTFEDYPRKNVEPTSKYTRSKGRIPEYFIILSIRHVNHNLHQPIACVYWDRKSKNLVDIIRIYIYALHLAGLTVVCTLCTEALHFRLAIRKLTNVKNLKLCKHALTYSVGPVKNIVHIFDPQSLLKGIRNVFMYYKAQFTKDGVRKTADWEVVDYWNVVCNENKFDRMIHIASEDMNKTEYAAKIFSKKVCAGIYDAAEKDILHQSAKGTAEFCLFFNDLYDTFNAFGEQNDCTFYRFPVKKTSGHFEFWEDALQTLESIKFIAYKTNTTNEGNTEINKHTVVNNLNNRVKNVENVSQEMLISIKENLDTFIKNDATEKPIVKKFDSKTNETLSMSDKEKDHIIETFVRKIKNNEPKNILTEKKNILKRDKTYLVLDNSKIGVMRSYKKENNEKPMKFSSPDRMVIDDPMGDISDFSDDNPSAVDDGLNLFKTENKYAEAKNEEKIIETNENKEKDSDETALNVEVDTNENDVETEDCNTELFEDEFVAFWILNVLGIKAIIENLYSKRYTLVKTKHFNLNNIYDFIGLLKVLNGFERDSFFESKTYRLLERSLALYCLAPKVSIILC